MSQYIYGEWRTKSQELQCVSELYEGGYACHPKKLTVIKNTFNQDIPDRMTTEMIEYPFTRGYELKSAKKILGLELEIKNNIPHIIGTNQTTNVKIQEVTTKEALRRFVDYPNVLYKDVESFVPAFFGDDMDDWNPKKNPAFSYCEAKAFLAWRDGEIVGRGTHEQLLASNETYQEIVESQLSAEEAA